MSRPFIGSDGDTGRSDSLDLETGVFARRSRGNDKEKENSS
jgi:hypothetical protein